MCFRVRPAHLRPYASVTITDSKLVSTSVTSRLFLLRSGPVTCDMAGWQWQLEGGWALEVSGSDPPAPAPTEPTLSKDQAARFDEDGYVELPNFYNPAEVRFDPACEPAAHGRSCRTRRRCRVTSHTVQGHTPK